VTQSQTTPDDISPEEDDRAQAKVDSTLSKGIQILETLSGSTQSMGVTELSRKLGLTKSNVFRLLQTLNVLGYVKQTENKQYSATLRTWQIGRKVLENLNLRELAAPEMRELSAQTRETVYLAVVENQSVVYIDKLESMQPIRSWNPIGGTAAIHCVSTGKAILAANYDMMRNLMIGKLVRHTDRSVTNMKDLDADVATTRERGYAVDRGEFRDRVYGVGSAIFLPDGKAIAAIGLSLPEINLYEGAVEKFGALVKEAAARITEKLAAS
jgi:IclR family transcriptional regulator, KDG regulon repressor